MKMRFAADFTVFLHTSMLITQHPSVNMPSALHTVTLPEATHSTMVVFRKCRPLVTAVPVQLKSQFGQKTLSGFYW